MAATDTDALVADFLARGGKINAVPEDIRSTPWRNGTLTGIRFLKTKGGTDYARLRLAGPDRERTVFAFIPAHLAQLREKASPGCEMRIRIGLSRRKSRSGKPILELRQIASILQPR